MTQPFDITGHCGIVTGAASGIGRATALHLAELGTRLALVDLNAEGLAQTAHAIAAAGGAEPLCQRIDITDEAAVQGAVRDALEAFGRIDFLVNSAGILQRTAFLEIDTAEWDRVMNVNLRGQFIFCREVLGPMKAAGRGSIVNVASLAGRTCSVLGGAHYTCAKHALVGLSRHLAREFGPHGIRVNALCPGATLTPMTVSVTPPEEIERIAAATPRRRWSEPAEQARIVAFLISDAAVAIVGAAVDANGGILML